MENLSLANYEFILFEYDVTKDAIWNSVTLGLSAAVITMFAGVMISYVIVKMKVRGKRILEDVYKRQARPARISGDATGAAGPVDRPLRAARPSAVRADPPDAARKA